MYEDHSRQQWEELARSAPDLIIADEYHSGFRERLKEIAPTVVIDLPAWDWRKKFYADCQPSWQGKGCG